MHIAAGSFAEAGGIGRAGIAWGLSTHCTCWGTGNYRHGKELLTLAMACLAYDE